MTSRGDGTLFGMIAIKCSHYSGKMIGSNCSHCGASSAEKVAAQDVPQGSMRSWRKSFETQATWTRTDCLLTCLCALCLWSILRYCTVPLVAIHKFQTHHESPTIPNTQNSLVILKPIWAEWWLSAMCSASPTWLGAPKRIWHRVILNCASDIC